MPTLITAGTASSGVVLTSSNDQALTLQVGAAGSPVNALSFAADGTPTFAKPLMLTQANQTPLPATASLLSYTHGLGAVPISAELEIVCLTAEFGYSVGDVVTPYILGNAGYVAPFTIVKNSTVVSARTGSVASFNINNNATGASGISPTSANWAWRFKVRTA